ncbi:MAG: hypothetical protein BWK78_05970 [Thiotrichaceae bacterium IS1]|nr:MAG: hypothetical protein BWK78_05970 [Thiotrichaceae bacterium IS1]
MNSPNLEYQRDFCRWIAQNVQWLRQGRFAEMDALNIAEELESMSISYHHALINRLKILLMHLLQWQFQPAKRTRSWKRTIIEQRQRIQQLLEGSPSLQYQISEKLTKAYQYAVPLAACETGLPKSTFPNQCQFTLEQILNEDFYPDADPSNR